MIHKSQEEVKSVEDLIKHIENSDEGIGQDGKGEEEEDDGSD